MLKGEMENHLGHQKGTLEDSDNVRNSYSFKTLKTSLGLSSIRVLGMPSTFEPQINQKSTVRRTPSIEGKVLAMYAVA